uniref:Uncharacterized protein n=2 Tax=PACMAD clade TaxID=147370 RepID=B8A1J8_MAIZE|nr:unknown [Zea mays]
MAPQSAPWPHAYSSAACSRASPADAFATHQLATSAPPRKSNSYTFVRFG